MKGLSYLHRAIIGLKKSSICFEEIQALELLARDSGRSAQHDPLDDLVAR